MKPIDVIDSVDFGYRVTWAERRYLFRLASVPMVIKFVCLATIMALGWDRQYLAIAIVMLPSFFADGWMLSHYTRLVFFGQRWPFRPSGNAVADTAMLNDRAYGVMSGILYFVLSKFLISGLVAFMSTLQASVQAQMIASPAMAQHADPSAGPMFAVLFLMGLTLWGFRFVFLYIPAAGGLPAKVMTRSSKSFAMSLQMVGIYLVCLVPFVILALYTAQILIPPPQHGAELGLGTKLFIAWGQVVVDTLVELVSTAAIASGIKAMIIEETNHENA